MALPRPTLLCHTVTQGITFARDDADPSRAPVSGCRTEQDEKPEIRHRLGKIGQALSDELGGDSGGHAVTVSKR